MSRHGNAIYSPQFRSQYVSLPDTCILGISLRVLFLLCLGASGHTLALGAAIRLGAATRLALGAATRLALGAATRLALGAATRGFGSCHTLLALGAATRLALGAWVGVAGSEEITQ